MTFYIRSIIMIIFSHLLLSSSNFMKNFFNNRLCLMMCNCKIRFVHHSWIKLLY